MKLITDWNCRLLPGFPDQAARAEDAADALTVLWEDLGVKRFCFFPVFDPETDSIPAFQIRENRALKALQSLFHFPAVFLLSASVRLVPGLAEYRGLNRFLLPKTDYLPVALPLSPDRTTENTLADLARHAPFRLLVTNAHLLPVFYPEPLLERVSRLPGLAFQFSFQALAEPQTGLFRDLLLARRVPILAGSGVRSPEQARRMVTEACFTSLQSRFSPSDLEKMLFGGQLYRKRA